MSVAKVSPVAIQARCVRLSAKAADAASLTPVVETLALSRGENDLLIEVKAAAVNPSDVKAATGLMPYAVFPRTPGRDYAGVVIDGPQGWIGREVFGSSGDLGIRRDGTHATHLVVEAEAVVEKPKGISWEEAAGIGVPFVTAMEGLRRAGIPKAGETVLVHGRQRQGRAGGGADRDLARRAGDRRRAQGRVVRGAFQFAGRGHRRLRDRCRFACPRTHRRQGRRHRLQHGRRSLFRGRAQIAGLRGRQILIAAVDRIVPFNILEFYRGQHTYVGIDTLGLSSVATGAVLRELGPGFAGGHLKPFPIKPNAIYPLEQAKAAFIAVAGSSRDRVILRPSA